MEHSNLARLIFLLSLPVALGVVLCLPYRQQHRVENGNLVYTCSPGVTYFFLAAILVFLSLPWWGPMLAPKSPGDVAGVGLFPAGCAALWLIWARAYRVVLSKDAVKSGAFWVKELDYREIQQAKLIRTGLIIYGGSGAKVRVERQLADFSSFMAEFKQRLPSGVKIEVLG